MSYRSWAENELDLIGLKQTDDDEDPNGWARANVIELLDVFEEQGHSGSSAPYVVSIFQKLASWKPLTPLTGADDEWNEVGTNVWQNKRASNVFKAEDGRAYWLDGIVWWEWYSSPDIYDGKPYKLYFTNKDSRVYIDFPWTQPDSPEYRESKDQLQ